MDNVQTSPVKIYVLLAALMVLLVGGGGGFLYYQIAQLRQQGSYSQDQQRQAKDRFVQIMGEKDLQLRTQKLQQLRDELTGSGLPLEQTVTDELIKSLSSQAAYTDTSLNEREKNVNDMVKSLQSARARLVELEKDIEIRQRELADKEAAAKTVLGREQELDRQKVAIENQRKTLKDYEQSLNKLKDNLDTQMQNLSQQAQKSALKQDELLQQIAELEAKQNDNQQKEIIVVPQPVPQQSTQTIIEKRYPVYIDLWGRSRVVPYKKHHYRYPYKPHYRSNKSKGFSFSFGW